MASIRLYTNAWAAAFCQAGMCPGRGSARGVVRNSAFATDGSMRMICRIDRLRDRLLR
ncbi:hypothetical protein Ga0080559_TMP3383 [Salipiger profundus]|uniref:Uncharacterized protein n=1 Tax=Salipiger profundus TaxID=1229727 RepID=A0A1U7D7S1_9RHOB|nr:hypothetical protein Ga0080559_TMP3383 [Salipiger profundus]